MKKLWEGLSENLQKEETIMGYRNTAQNLRKLYLKKLAAIRINENKMIAFAALWPTNDPFWLEAGSVWVHPEFRGKRYSSETFQELIQKSARDGKNIFSITHSVREMIHLFEKHGFVEVQRDRWDDTVPFSVTCAPCDKKEKVNCDLKGSKCRLFYFP